MVIQELAYFVDLNTNFKLNNRDIIVLNHDAIKNQIDNIINTTPGERFGDLDSEPDFGSSVGNMLFDPIDDVTAWRIETALYRAINRWLGSRVALNYSDSFVKPDIKTQSYTVSLSYVVYLTGVTTYYKINIAR